MFRTGVLGLALTVFAGCSSEGSSITWRLVFADSILEERAVGYSAQIRRGFCSSVDGTVLYNEDFRDEQGPPAPALRHGSYAFSATATDQSCVRFAEGCEQVTLPIQGDSQVIIVRLLAIEESMTCEGRCVNGVCDESDIDADIEDADIEDGDVGDRDVEDADIEDEVGDSDRADVDIEEEAFDYTWLVSDECVDECSEPCGGTCPLDVYCERDDGLRVDDSYCSEPKPADTEPCICCSTAHRDMVVYSRCSGGWDDMIYPNDLERFGDNSGSMSNRRECAESCTAWASGSYSQWCCELVENPWPETNWGCAAHSTLGIVPFTDPDSQGGYAVIGSCE